MARTHKTSKLSRGRSVKVFVFIAIFAVIGTLLVILTRAAAPTAQLSVNNGTLTGNASVVTDPGVANGSVVQFGSLQQPSTGSRPFSASSLWNTPIPTNSTWRDEPSLRNGHSWLNREQYSMPVARASASDPLVTINVPASWGNPAGPIKLRVPLGITGDSGTDGTVVIISGNTVCDIWQFRRNSDTSANAQAYACDDISTGTGFGTSSPFKGAGIRAAGSSSLAGLLVGEDFTSGVRDQAVAVSLLPSLLKRGWVAPAINEDGGGSNTYSGSIPMGSRLGIPQSTTMPSGLSPGGVMLWNALKKYGAFVVDQHFGDSPAIFYADPLSTTDAQVAPLRIWWNGKASDIDLIMPALRVKN